MKQYDLVVVGGGPGGYVAAIKAAQSGLKTACVEARKTLGGTCLNVGCIPSKFMLNATHVAHEAKTSGGKYAFAAKDVSSDFAALSKKRDATVTGLTKGIEFLFKKNKIDYIHALARITEDAEGLKLSGSNTSVDGETLRPKNIILATGSVPSQMPGGILAFDGKRVISSDGLMTLQSVPKRLVIVGGGAIGLECASIMSRLGSNVTIVEFLPQVGAGFDNEVGALLQKSLAKEKVKIHCSHRVVEAKVDDSGVKIYAEKVGKEGGERVCFEGDVVVVSVGRRPFTTGLGVKEAGIEEDKFGRVVTDEFLRVKTSGGEVSKNMFAIGDLVQGPMLAHKAEEDGVAAVNNILGHEERMDYSVIPAVIYTHPEAASVGRTEADLKKDPTTASAFTKGVFSMAANSRARCNQDSDGFVKIMAAKESGKILGASIVAPAAGDLIQSLVMAMKYDITVKQVADLVHAHPTTSEAIKEAALAAAYGKCIHS